MWDAPDFRVSYDLKVLHIFDHAHPIIIKLTLVFLNLYQHAKNQLLLSINSLETQQISEFHYLKGHAHFWPQQQYCIWGNKDNSFFMKRFYTQKKKVLKKHISKYALTKHSNKKSLIYILCSLCFFMKIYMQACE